MRVSTTTGKSRSTTSTRSPIRAPTSAPCANSTTSSRSWPSRTSRRLIDEYRRVRADVAVPTVLDIGCSYGINAALLKYDAHHGRAVRPLRRRRRPAPGDPRRAAGPGPGAGPLRRTGATHVRFSGSTPPSRALAYALEAGFLDGAVHADLENERADRAAARPARRDGPGDLHRLPRLRHRAHPCPRRAAPGRTAGRGWRTSCCGCSRSTRSPRCLAELGYEHRPRRRRVPAAAVRLAGGAGARAGPLAAAGVDPAGVWRPTAGFYAQLHISQAARTRATGLRPRTEVRRQRSRVSRPARLRQRGPACRGCRCPRWTRRCERFLEWCAPLLTADERARDRGRGGGVRSAPAAPAARCTRRWNATTPRRACTAGSTPSGRTATWAAATGSP